jgi:predicted DNA-binding transcriptional regulator YafY
MGGIHGVTGDEFLAISAFMPKPAIPRRIRRPSTASFRSGVSRPAIWRVMEIHKIIRGGRFPNCRTLAAKIEVTPKTIQRDISFMRDQLGLPLEYHAIKHGFFYSQEVHEFPMLQLSRNDLVALFLARHALEPLRGTRLERMLRESFSKIAEACPGEISIQWQELDDIFSVKAAGVLAADVTLFGDLLDAVRGCREVSFDYHKLTAQQPARRTVRPHHVGQIEHGWYLIAFDPSRRAMRTFALQRISNLMMLKTKFTREPGFSARDHLGGGFGVWSYAGEARRLHQVLIRFEGYAARVVAERQWHPTQAVRKLKPDGSQIEFQADLSGLEEITRWVLSWGSKARVLGPPELQQRVARELKLMTSV